MVFYFLGGGVSFGGTHRNQTGLGDYGGGGNTVIKMFVLVLTVIKRCLWRW